MGLCLRICFFVSGKSASSHWLPVILHWIKWRTISTCHKVKTGTKLWTSSSTFSVKLSQRRCHSHDYRITLVSQFTVCVVKANSERQLTHRRLQLGSGDRLHENRIKLPWPPIPLHASFMRAISTCHYRPSNSTHCDFDLSSTPRKRNLILMSLFSKDIGLSFAFPS